MINSINYNPSIQNIRNISFKSNSHLEAQADVFIKSNVKPQLSIQQEISDFLTGRADSIKVKLPDGEISKISKTSETPDIKTKNLKEELSDRISLKFLDAFGVDYKETEEELAGLFKEYLSDTGTNTKNKDYDWFISQMKTFGFNDGKNLAKGYRNVYNALYATTLDTEFLFDKKHNAIKQNQKRIEEETNTPLGIKIYKEFLKEIAEEYHLRYETDMK